MYRKEDREILHEAKNCGYCHTCFDVTCFCFGGTYAIVCLSLVCQRQIILFYYGYVEVYNFAIVLSPHDPLSYNMDVEVQLYKLVCVWVFTLAEFWNYNHGYARDSQIPGARSPGVLSFIRWRLIFFGPSMWYLIHVTLQAPGILIWLSNVGNIFVPLSYAMAEI